jgi:hypothetical protein
VRASVVSFRFSRLARAVAALWLCCAAPAWAGDGADLGSINTAWQTFCGVTLPSFGVKPPCPQIPTITQGILQLTAGQLVPPAMVRATNSTPLGQAVDAGNPSLPPATLATTPATTAITKFPVTGPALSNLLPVLTPLGFISSPKGPAAVTQLYNPNAEVFLYGVASGFLDNGGQPDTAFFFYDDTSRTNGNLQQGQIVAQFSLPLVVLTGYNISAPIETTVPTTLQFRATSAGDCSTSTVIGNFKAGSTTPQTLMAAQIGINCAVVFAPSPLSTKSHAIFEVAVPLIITMATDPLYFTNNYSVIGGPWNSDVTGFPATNSAFPTGAFIGLPPSAAPLGPPPAMGVAAAYALCANLPGGNGNGQAPVPAVAAFYAIASDGETVLSAPFPASSTSVCPF